MRWKNLENWDLLRKMRVHARFLLCTHSRRIICVAIVARNLAEKETAIRSHFKHSKRARVCVCATGAGCESVPHPYLQLPREIRCERAPHMFVIKFSSIHDFICDRHSVASFSLTARSPSRSSASRMPLCVWQKVAYKKLKVFFFFLSSSSFHSF